MFWLIAILLFFIVGLAAFELIQQDSGYVLLSLGGISVESSFWFAVFVLVSIVVVFFVLFVCIKSIGQSMTRSSRWVREKRAHTIEKNYRDALLHFLTDNYSDANRLFSSLSRKSDLPVVKAIASSRSYFQSGDTNKALVTLDKAEKEYHQDKYWILKARYLLFLALKDTASASSTLDELKAINSEDSFLNKLECKLLLPSDESRAISVDLALKNQPLLAGPESDLLLLSVLSSASEDKNTDLVKIEKLWSNVSKEKKENPKFQSAYTKALISVQEKGKAEKFIEKTLSKHWNAELVDLYAKTEFSNIDKQLKKAESWKKAYSNYHELFVALGVLAVKNQYWGQARSYLNTSIEIQETRKALYLLGYVAEHLGEKDESFAYYKRSAELQKL